MVSPESDAETELDRLQSRAETDPGSLDPEAIATVVTDAATASEAVESVLRPAIGSSPELAERVVKAVCPALRTADLKTRHNAAVALVNVGETRPDALSPAIPDLVAALDADAKSIVDRAARVLAAAAPRAPDGIEEAAPALDDLFESDLRYRNARAAAVAAGIAESDPEALSPLAGALVNIVLHEPDTGSPRTVQDRMVREQMTRNEAWSCQQSEQLRRDAGSALLALARSDPIHVSTHLDELASSLAVDDNPYRRALVAHVFATVAERRPDLVAPYTWRFEALLAADDVYLRGIAARTLGLLAEERPDEIVDAVRPHLNRIKALLDAEHAETRSAGAGLLSHVAEVTPNDVTAYIPDLLNLLEDDAAFVRGNSAIALGYVDDEDAYDHLFNLARDDPDEEVRAVARDAVGPLEDIK